MNERAISVPVGTDMVAAIRALDPDLAAALDEGRAHATDGVGRGISPSTPTTHGAIFRVVRAARRPSS